MSDVLDVIHRLGSMSSKAAMDLRAAIAEAQAVLDKLDAFTRESDNVGQLAAASDLYPAWSANIPEGSGLTRKEQDQP